jgi:F-type H+-transporting ATPase subunit b
MLYLAQEAEHNPILPIWQEWVIGSIAFTLLCVVLMKFVFPRMEETFRARVDAIEGGIKRAEAAQAEANALLEQYRQQLAEARTEAARIRDDARRDAVEIREEMLARAAEERDRVIAAGQEQLAAQRQSIVRELRAELGELAVELAGRIVGESLADEARRHGTVERFLAELDSTEPAGAGAGGAGAGAGRAGAAGTGGRR